MDESINNYDIDLILRCACGRVMQLVPAGYGYWVWSCPVHGAATYTTSNSTTGESSCTLTTSTSTYEKEQNDGSLRRSEDS